MYNLTRSSLQIKLLQCLLFIGCNAQSVTQSGIFILICAEFECGKETDWDSSEDKRVLLYKTLLLVSSTKGDGASYQEHHSQKRGNHKISAKSQRLPKSTINKWIKMNGEEKLCKLMRMKKDVYTIKYRNMWSFSVVELPIKSCEVIRQLPCPSDEANWAMVVTCGWS